MDKISEITRRDIVDIIKSGFSVELDEEEYDSEGRGITLEFDEFYLVNFNAKIKLSIIKKKPRSILHRLNLSYLAPNHHFLLLCGQKTFYYNWQKRSIISLRYFLET